MSCPRCAVQVFPSSGRQQPALLLGCLVTLFLMPLSAQADLVRNKVGPDGDFPTIQAAVDACPSGDTCQVDVQVPTTSPFTYPENVTIPSTFTSGSMTITGGWNSTFTVRDTEPSLTTIDGGGAGGVLDVAIGGGTFTLDGFTVTGGSALNGAGIHVNPDGASFATVKLVNLKVRDNHASSTYSSFGGGIWGELDGTERLEVKGCVVQNNTATVTSGTGAAAGAGILVSASGTATFLVEHSWVEENTASSDTGRKDGAGHFFGIIGNATGEVVNLRVTDNTASGSEAQVNGSGGMIYLTENAQIVVRRSVWALNTDSTGDVSEQLRVWCGDDTSLLITDSAVALGDGSGLYGAAGGATTDTAELRLVNLTVVDNTVTGIELFEHANSTVTLHNSISYGNGTDATFDPNVDTGNNLIGVNPLFVDPPNYNYRLDHGSQGLDTGNNSPPGGLGPTDLDGLPRLENGTVDKGCYEGAGMLFYDGFEGGGTGEWSSAVL